MNAVILAPGPSLSDYSPYPADVVVGVNRAAAAHTCAYWTCLDAPALRQFQPQILGRPRLLTRTEYRPKHTTIPGPSLEEVQAWASGVDVSQYSAVAALALAGWLGANEVDVYGADWTDEPDFDGYRHVDQNRGPRRWERERGYWEALTALLQRRGVSVRRVHAQPA